MPTSIKPRELFYVKDGEQQDAEIHEEILAGGDNAAAELVSREVAERLGLLRPVFRPPNPSTE